MKKLLSLAVALLLIVSAIACGAAEGKPFEGQTLTISTFSFNAELLQKNIYDPFMEQTGATLVVDTGRNAERMLMNWAALEQTDATMFQTNVNTYLALPTDEEVETLAEYNADLTTAMNDLFVELIRGDKDIEKLDEYLEELRDLGLDEVIGVYQSRYNRFKGE